MTTTLVNLSVCELQIAHILAFQQLDASDAMVLAAGVHVVAENIFFGFMIAENTLGSPELAARAIL